MTSNDSDDVLTPHIVRDSGPNRGTISVNIPHGDSSDMAGNPTITCDDSDDVRRRPHIERGRVSNPSMTDDESDGVLAQTTHRAR